MANLRSGDRAHCTYCGYKGFVHGVPIFGGSKSGVSAPWCPECGLNEHLVPLTSEKQYCTNCGRQVVSYDASTDKYVGSVIKPVTRDVNGVICHECIADENAFYNMLEGAQ